MLHEQAHGSDADPAAKAQGERFTAGVGHNYALDVALEGFAVLHQMDLQKGDRPYWTPSMAKEEHA